MKPPADWEEHCRKDKVWCAKMMESMINKGGQPAKMLHLDAGRAVALNRGDEGSFLEEQDNTDEYENKEKVGHFQRFGYFSMGFL